MKSTNVVKHSNIVDREKRSEALGTGKLFSFSLLHPPPATTLVLLLSVCVWGSCRQLYIETHDLLRQGRII